MRKILLFSLMTLFTLGVCAQKRTDRAYVRVGNRMFRDSLFIKAEENYLKAVDMNPELLEGYFNLGNAYVGQQKPNEAIDAFRKASNMLEAEKKTLMNDPKADADALDRCKMNLAQTYHNTGVVYHVCQQFDKAIEAYKDALRNNPQDDQTATAATATAGSAAGTAGSATGSAGTAAGSGSATGTAGAAGSGGYVKRECRADT